LGVRGGYSFTVSYELTEILAITSVEPAFPVRSGTPTNFAIKGTGFQAGLQEVRSHGFAALISRAPACILGSQRIDRHPRMSCLWRSADAASTKPTSSCWLLCPQRRNPLYRVEGLWCGDGRGGWSQFGVHGYAVERSLYRHTYTSRRADRFFL